MRRSALVGGCWAALIALLFAPFAFAVEGPTLQDRIGAIAKTTLSPQGPETPGLLRGGCSIQHRRFERRRRGWREPWAPAGCCPN